MIEWSSFISIMKQFEGLPNPITSSNTLIQSLGAPDVDEAGSAHYMRLAIALEAYERFMFEEIIGF